jgi:hypothetical protein
MRRILVTFLVATLLLSLWIVSYGLDKQLDKQLEKLCNEGDLYSLLKYFHRSSRSEVSTLFGLSALNWILYSNVDEAVRLHLDAKALGTNTVPPLANLYLKGNSCGGMADLFYVSAVTMKQLVDSNVDEKILNEARLTMITLTSDTGLPHAAEAHLRQALLVSPNDAALNIRATLMTPGIFENEIQIQACRKSLEERAAWLHEHQSLLSLHSLDEFVLSPTFYFIYQGYNDRTILRTLHQAYASAYPALGHIGNEVATSYSSKQQFPKLRIGFVSAYFRRHSVCKLFCGVIRDLAEFHGDKFEVFVFSSLQENKEDATTQELRNTTNIHFFSVGRLLLNNRHVVTDQRIDILIYLDIGMDPAGLVWAAARLATVQMCLWGHPSTTALPHIDYYLSSKSFHQFPTFGNRLYNISHPSNVGPDEDSHAYRFEEQLVQFDDLGIAFSRPTLTAVETIAAEAIVLGDKMNSSELYLSILANNHHSVTLKQLQSSLASSSVTPAQENLQKLLELRLLNPSKPVILCPQFLPKLHPVFDEVLTELLLTDEENEGPVLVLLSSKKKRLPWHLTLTKRLQRQLTERYKVKNPGAASNGTKIKEHVKQVAKHRIMWMDDMNPQEYLQLMYLGDVMLDPFPFGGGVTVLESLSLCTPIVTAPSLQTVPQLATGILQKLFPVDTNHRVLEPFLAESVLEYIQKVKAIVRSEESMQNARDTVCNVSNRVFHPGSTIARVDSSIEYAHFFARIVQQLTV